MRNLLIGLSALGILASTVGCANRPFGRWMGGAPCNTCNPAVGQPMASNFAGSCDSGNCSAGTTSSGFMGSMFRPQGSGTTAPPLSAPANSFEQAPAGFQGDGYSGSEYYGNANNTGQLELPPLGT